MLLTYKKKGGGDKALPSNYRPISLTSVVGKLMETMILNKLVSFLKENIMNNNTQQGFHNKRSCLTNLPDFYNNIFNIYHVTK